MLDFHYCDCQELKDFILDLACFCLILRVKL
nr:MAG TPA: hypothetical protein [Caudoviricetes sp.]DAW46940.1 MAG TPA: hypothetical protein [Caudoviricetes sp.]